MSRKVNPFLFRVNLNRNWNSIWYIKRNHYSSYLLEDLNIRNFLRKLFLKKPIGKIIIFKNSKFILINIYVKKGFFFNKLNYLSIKKNLSLFTEKNIFLRFKNIIIPDLDVKILFFYIKRKIESKKSYKGVIKNIINNVFKFKCLGIKIVIHGRINGNVMTRKQVFYYGKLPLHKINSNIRYFSGTAFTIYGCIGIKIWLYLGDFIY